MKRVNPKKPAAKLPRTQAQRKQMLDAAATRRREEARTKELRHAQSRIATERARNERLEGDLLRARVAASGSFPETNAYVDQVIASMISEITRTHAIRLMDDPGMSDYMAHALRMAARMIEVEYQTLMRPKSMGDIALELRDSLNDAGIELSVHLPPLSLTCQIDPMMVNMRVQHREMRDFYAR